MNLTGAKILLTGGSLGIGRETARLLVESGARVMITGRDKKRLEKAASETGAIPMVADVADPADVARTYAEVQAQLGGLDVLINNAGIGEFGLLEDLTLESYQKVYATNVFGAAMMAQKAVQIFKKQSSGHIINISSTAGVKGFKGGSVYAASKFALRGMTQCWQEELRPYNIRVILVNPSEVTTAFGNPDRKEREDQAKKLRSQEIAHVIKSSLDMDNRGFIPEVTVWATNPF